MLIRYSVLVLVQKVFCFVLDIMGIVSNRECTIRKPRFLKVVLELWSGKARVELLNKSLIRACRKTIFLG